MVKLFPCSMCRNTYQQRMLPSHLHDEPRHVEGAPQNFQSQRQQGGTQVSLVVSWSSKNDGEKSGVGGLSHAIFTFFFEGA